MPSDDPLSAAIEELYSIDPDDFTKRRNALAAEARKAGDGAAAKSITELRRPTKAAGIVNRLARAQPDVAAGLTGLGADLRKAQRALDGARMRELTQQRRKLIDSATRQAFELSGLTEPTATLQHEVASTFEAALADPDVAEQFTAGTLVRSAEWSGFGDSSPSLSAVPSSPSSERATKAPVKRQAGAKGKAATAMPAGDAADEVVDTAKERRLRRVTAAQEVLDGTAAELAEAEAAEGERAQTVKLLSEQLADARRRLDEARLGLRRARNRHREAEHKLAQAKR